MGLMPFYVLKLGGSLIDSSRDLVGRLCELQGEGYSFLIVPGGGPMADLVRALFTRHGISQERAHWMAILAMEQYAYFLADGTGACLTTKIHRPRNAVEILKPYQALQRDDGGLEHSWDFTSDSVAAMVALRLDSPLVKATNVDGLILDGSVQEEVCASRLLGEESCIDQGTLRLFLKDARGKSIWILNGTDPQRFVRALRSGRGGTRIRF